jgi:periplasmic divalent cation tolerance protein
MIDVRLVLTTVGSEAEGEKIARALVEERLAACVNIIPGLRSIYRWKGEINDAGELLLLIKTTGSRVDEVRERLESMHPYDLPEFLVIAPESAGADYAEWMADNTHEG